ncbi:MAG TPA: alpha/beta hydrolase, partial [Chloroflexaceae bacterium]|nr:alpha/beta hydrolase [Chloroflexaceae bacterium]
SLDARGDAERFPPPGRLVDVGGYSMHIHCVGTGGPTVVLDSGYAGAAVNWHGVLPALAEGGRVCLYDRAGLGWSEPSPRPRTPRAMAAELRTLLERAGERGPYVLAGLSLGAKYVRAFALDYPEEVAGLVFADARNEYFDALAAPSYRATEERLIPLFAALSELTGRVGLARLLPVSEPAAPHQLSAADQRARNVLATRPRAVAAARAEFFGQFADNEALAAASLGDLPVVVLAAGKGGMAYAGWAEAQERLAAQSSRGRLVVLPEAGHDIPASDPAAFVAAVAEVVAAAR